MLRPGRHYKYAQPNPYETHEEYKIAPYDILSFSITANNGEKLLTGGGVGLNNLQTGVGSSNYLQQGLSYREQGGIGVGTGNTIEVESDGKAKFPIFGRIEISGMTIREAERMLEEKFSVYFKEPFVQVRVTNKRVIIIYSGGIANQWV